MGIGSVDGGLGASQQNLETFTSPISDPSEPASASSVNEDSSNGTVAKPQLQQHLNSPSHLRITINTEHKKIEIEQVKVTLVYKSHDMESTEEKTYTSGVISDNARSTASEFNPQVTEFNVKDVIVEGVIGNEGRAITFPENKETGDENDEVYETTEDVNNILSESHVGKRGDTNKKVKQYEDKELKEPEANGVEEQVIREIENLSIKEDNISNENEEDNEKGEISSLDGIILPTEEEKELFRAPSLLLVFDYRLDEWKVREFGEILILQCPGNNYQLQFRRYRNDGYETSLTMALRSSFKLHEMRHSRSHSWEWTVHYIGAGAGEFRTLAAKFLSREVAYQFYEKVKECVVTLKSQGDTLDACEGGFLTPSQSIRLISRTPTPTFGPGTMLSAKSADICGRSPDRVGSYWTSPISSKFRKIRRDSNNIETGSSSEDYQIKKTRLCLSPPQLKNENNSTESKVSLVYKCYACGLCFDRPEILLDSHLSKCSPTTKLVKTKCACGLDFDQYNFAYHCQVHRQHTALNVKKIVVRDEKNIDVREMKEVFLEMGVDEAAEAVEGGSDNNTGEGPTTKDESNARDKIEDQSVAVKKRVMETKVANRKAVTNVPAVQKTCRVYVCQCRLCFDRAEFYIRHLSKCSIDTKVVRTTCICDLVFDKYNFRYHCEVHRQVSMLNVKYIVVRDEGILDISGMVQEFVEDEEIEFTEVALVETMDQSKYLVYDPAPKYEDEQNVMEEIINYQKVSTTEENLNSENAEKANHMITENTEKATDNQTHHEIHEIIRSQENETDDSQEVPLSTSEEVTVFAETISEENCEIPIHSEVNEEFTEKNEADLGPSHFDKTVGDNILATEKQQDCNSDTDAIEIGKKFSLTTEEILAKDENPENTLSKNVNDEKNIMLDKTVTMVVSPRKHSLETEIKEILDLIRNGQENYKTIKNIINNNDIKQQVDENKTNGIEEQFNKAVKEIYVPPEIIDKKNCNIPNSSEACSEKINESDLAVDKEDPESKLEYYSDPNDSDKRRDNTVEQMLVKNTNHVENNTATGKNKEETTVDLQSETGTSSKSKIEHDPESKENGTPDLTENSACIKEIVQIPDENKKNDNIEDTEAYESQEANAAKENNVAIKTCNAEKTELPDKMESDGKVNTSDMKNNLKDSNSLKPTADTKGNDNSNTKQVSDKKNGNINVKLNKKEDEASNATNNQRKSGKQGRKNASSASNKRSNRGKK